jgi:hypothetical protein
MRDFEATPGTMVQGTWVEGLPHGAAIVEVDRWGARYEGAMEGGRRHGRGRATLPNGDTYDGEFHCGAYHGRGVYTSPAHGASYDGEWQHNTRTGYGKALDKTGSGYEGAWANNAPCAGRGREYRNHIPGEWGMFRERQPPAT